MEEKDRELDQAALEHMVEESRVGLMYIEAIFNAFESVGHSLPMGDYTLVYDLLGNITDTIDILSV